MKQAIYPKSRETDVVVQHLNGEVLIYDLSRHKAFCLNETSGAVWHLCDGKRSVGEISERLGRELKTPVSEDLIWLALDGLKKDELLENGDEMGSGFAGVSRREVIKKIALTSAVALPLISSLVAPPAASAASGVTCAATACTCSGTAPVSSCGSLACQNGCTCRIANTMTDCQPDGFGGFTCNGTCAV